MNWNIFGQEKKYYLCNLKKQEVGNMSKSDYNQNCQNNQNNQEKNSQEKNSQEKNSQKNSSSNCSNNKKNNEY